MYGKIFQEIFDSSIVQYGGDTIYVFMSLIILADEDGFVRLNPIALAAKIVKPIDVIKKALSNLERSDPESNDPSYKGRRIIPLSEVTEGVENRGWWVPSHKRWRELARKMDQRERTRERMKRWRGKKDVTPCDDGVTARDVSVTTSEAESEAYMKESRDSFGGIMKSWNEYAEKNDLAKISVIQPKSERARHLEARTREKDWNFGKLLEMVSTSPFLLGLKFGKNGPFFVTFDWLLWPGNYRRTMDGNYLERKGKIQQQKKSATEQLKELEKQKDDKRG